MIIVAPEEIRRYVAVDEEGQWIHDPNMPADLEKLFWEFVEQAKKAEEYQRNFLE